MDKALRTHWSQLTHWTLSLIMLLMALPSVAQSPSTAEPPLYDSRFPASLMEMKLSAAVGISSLLQNYGSVINGLSDLQLSPGALVRAGLDVRFVLRRSFAIGTGMSFDINNSKYALSMIDNNTGSINSLYVNNRYYEVTVPLYLSWRLNLGRRMVWNIDAGAYLAFAAGGTMHGSGYTTGQNSLGQPIINLVRYKTKYFRDNQAIINGVKSRDYGPRIATGLTYRKHYSLNLVFEVSASNLAINHNVLDVNYRNIALAFEFGYNF